MKQIYSILLLCLSLGFANAQSGTKINVEAHHEINLFAQNKIVVNADFPGNEMSYQNVTMLLTMECMNGDSCSHWDYDLDVYVGDSTGVMDSTIASLDTVSTNPVVLDTTWNVFEIVNWHELGRYVTPYGNYMNWNQNGFSGDWKHLLKYDATDFSTLLRGDNVPIRVYFHGWQKGFRVSVDFEITEGNPTRDALSVENIYRGGNYTTFAQFDADRTPATTVSIPEDADEAKLRVIVTGHGQSGEFTPIDYTVKANGSVVRMEEIWRDDCDMLPLSPQGGTWIYSRANWCPGDAVEIHEFELTDYIQGSGANKNIPLDIDLTDYAPANGASYSLSAQLITYDSYRRDYDVMIDEIVAPSNNDHFTRFNPICDHPIIRIKNYGKQTLNYCEIEYWIDHTNKFYFDWNGSLLPGETADVALPSMTWTNLDDNNLEFFATVNWPNNFPDQFPFNNEAASMFETPVIFTTNAIQVRFRTNNKPEENAYTIIASDGTVVADENTFNPSTFNTEDFFLQNGCYTFEMTDYGTDWEAGDGLNWWVNTQNGIETAGFVEFRNGANNTVIQTFQSDFGAQLRMPFLIFDELETVTGSSSNVRSAHPATTPYTSPTGEEFLQVYDTVWVSEDRVIFSTEAPTAIGDILENYSIDVYPNPTNGLVSIFVASDQNMEIDLRILNLLGEELDALSVPSNQATKYRLEDLSAGFYLFSFEIEGKTITKKISLFK